MRLIPSLLLPSLKVTLSGCTTCRPGDRFTAQVTLDNPTAAPVPVEVKVGMWLPDGRPSNTLGDRHTEGALLVGTLGPFTILDMAWPNEVPTGNWRVEGALLEPELGKTLSRDAKTFTAAIGSTAPIHSPF